MSETKEVSWDLEVQSSSSSPEVAFSTSVEGGIERVVCVPVAHTSRHKTPLLLLHGMWHGAWCWRSWQEELARRGFESVAFSLPSHGGSEYVGSMRFATMGYYMEYLRREVDRFGPDRRPVVVGHSLGGALVQWFLKYVGDLPAAVLVASWTARSTFYDGTLLHLRRDPIGFIGMGITYSTWPLIRNPQVAASMLLGSNVTISATQLHAKLDQESYLVLCQHNPPLWWPRAKPATPILWVAAKGDAVVTLAGARSSAELYGAELVEIEGGHDLMFEKNGGGVGLVADWLAKIVP